MSLGTAILFVGAAWLLQITGMNIHDWIEAEMDNGKKMREGLWQRCIEDDPCKAFDQKTLPAWHKTSQAFAILAVIGMSWSTIAGVIVCCLGKLRGCLTVAPFLAFAGGIFSLISLLVYASNVSHYALKYGIGFILCSVASSFSFAGFGFYTCVDD